MVHTFKIVIENRSTLIEEVLINFAQLPNGKKESNFNNLRGKTTNIRNKFCTDDLTSANRKLRLVLKLEIQVKENICI
jgi:hypothetical protein